MPEIILGGRPWSFRPLTIAQLRKTLAGLKSRDPAVRVFNLARAIGYAVADPEQAATQIESAPPAATEGEMIAAFGIVMTASGAFRNGVAPADDGPRPMPASSVRVGDREYSIPALSAIELEHLRCLPTEDIDVLDVHLRDVHVIMRSAYPELTLDRLERVLDLPTAWAILDNVAAQMSFARASFRAPPAGHA
jgi:hypothetical protein